MKYIKGKNLQVVKDEAVELPFMLPAAFSVADGMVWSVVDRRLWLSCLFIAKGWTWDGASFFLFRWFGTPKRWVLPSLYHDALYAPIRRGLLGREYRDAIDKMFRDELIKRGVGKWEAQIAYWCIRIGGNFAVRKDVVVREAV